VNEPDEWDVAFVMGNAEVIIVLYPNSLHAVCTKCRNRGRDCYDFDRTKASQPWNCRNCGARVKNSAVSSDIGIHASNATLRHWVSPWLRIPVEDIKVEVSIDGTS